MKGDLIEIWQKTLIGASAVTAALGYGVWDSRVLRRERLVQERQIRTMAADALTEILRTEFPLKPLLREQEQTVRELMHTEARPEFALLLESK